MRGGGRGGGGGDGGGVFPLFHPCHTVWLCWKAPLMLDVCVRAYVCV